MSKNRVLIVVGLVFVAILGVATSVHAAAGPGHGPESCPACMVLCCLEGLFG